MKKTWTILCVIAAIIFLAIAIYYWVTPAGSLPSWVPGYTAGSNHIHLKHGLAALILTIAFGILAWFTGHGDKKKTT